jgi:hypothetical protein
VWILSGIRFGNHKSSLYSFEMLIGIELQRIKAETLAVKGFHSFLLNMKTVIYQKKIC